MAEDISSSLRKRMDPPKQPHPALAALEAARQAVREHDWHRITVALDAIAKALA